MPYASHRTRYVVIILLLTWLGLVLLSRPAHGGWNTWAVEVHPTTALCPLVSVSDDAAYGALVVWQENTALGGRLKARHLLASGDLDPAWASPVMLSTADVPRTALGSVSDGTGGAYVWWMEAEWLYLTRIAPNGSIAAGWNARGRVMGALVSEDARPLGHADGSGGVYLGWLSLAEPQFVSIRVAHVGPANTGKDGWTFGSRVLGGTFEHGESVNGFAIDAAPGGGLWLAFATTTVNAEPPGYAAGDVRITRVTAAGLPANGWDAHGVSVAPFRGDLVVQSPEWGYAPNMSLAAVANDGATGAYVLYGDFADPGGGPLWPAFRLARVDQAGAPAGGWAPGGIAVTHATGLAPTSDPGATWSLRALADGMGGVHAGLPGFYSHGSAFQFLRVSGAGATVASEGVGDMKSLEFAPRGDGGLFLASFWPNGPTGPYQPAAHIRAEQSDPGTGYSAWHPEPWEYWYGDIGISATGDGGAIFAWSQVNMDYGVFAVRMNPSGLVTGVPPTSTRSGLHVWFARGAGVRVQDDGAGRYTLRIHDVNGREVASGSSDGSAAATWTVPGTAELPSGIYFASSSRGGVEGNTKIVVIR